METNNTTINIEGLLSDDPYVVAESFGELTVGILAQLKECVRVHVYDACDSIMSDSELGSDAHEESWDMQIACEESGPCRSFTFAPQFTQGIRGIVGVASDRELTLADIYE